jgi:hypothetical protein
MCCRWFGTPSDEVRATVVIASKRNSCSRNPFTGTYYISMRESIVEEDERRQVLAHEIYHRVTTRRKGLHRTPWVDEMIAYLATQRMLVTGGHQELAQQLELAHRLNEFAISVRDLHSVKRKRFLFGDQAQAYPEGFGTAVALLGIELSGLIDWRSICALVKCKTWESWIEQLPSNVRANVVELLQIPRVANLPL